jgi:teichuronic acid biosynthesis glycosyltransferase TuaC
MKVLVVSPNYPYPGYRFAGIFNQKCVDALNRLCDRVEVVAPRPYVPPLLSSLVPRWKAYATAGNYEKQNGIDIHRPAIPVVPYVAQAFWADQGTFFRCRQLVRQLHNRTHFDAIISFDLGGAGGVAWRIGRDLDIPASGWATGGDVRVAACSPHGRVIARALSNLDLVFYQSGELLDKAAKLLEVAPWQLARDRHIVLARGIPEPPELPKIEVRNRIRTEWGLKADEIVVLYLGRISREKGLLELLDALKLATVGDSRLRGVLVGSRPGFDDTALIDKRLRDIPGLRQRVTLFRECNPEKVWEYLCAADIFAFPSHNEGMPNSLLEAMVIGVPAIAFAIPAIRELEGGTGALALVPPFDSRLFAKAVVSLAESPDERNRIGEKGKLQVMDRFMVKKNMANAMQRLCQCIDRRRRANNSVNC